MKPNNWQKRQHSRNTPTYIFKIKHQSYLETALASQNRTQSQQSIVSRHSTVIARASYVILIGFQRAKDNGLTFREPARVQRARRGYINATKSFTRVYHSKELAEGSPCLRVLARRREHVGKRKWRMCRSLEFEWSSAGS